MIVILSAIRYINMSTGRQKTEMMELAQMLRQLSARLESMEGRLDLIERQLQTGVVQQRTAWAEPRFKESYAGLSISSSSTPTSMMQEQREIMLGSADEQIVQFIRKRDAVCAEDVRVEFKYKGKNAASARLNKLAQMGVLEKQQVGRKVYYKISE
jgi:hypothetical protein